MGIKISSWIKYVHDFLFPPSEKVKIIEHVRLQHLLQRRLIHWSADKKIVALLPYKDELVRSIIHELKYKKNEKAGKLCAEIIFKEIIETLPSGNYVFVPMPISKARRVARGFNQCEMIIGNILYIINNKPLLDKSFRCELNLLVKNQETRHQTSQKRKERLENIKNCFSLSNDTRLHGEIIILIDDVTTTGTTMNEAIRALEKSSAQKVLAIAVAH
jgi:competence protein ComFC